MRLVAISAALGAAVALLASSGLAGWIDGKAYDAWLSLSPRKSLPAEVLVVEPLLPWGAEAPTAKESLAVLRLVEELGARSLVLVGPAYAGQADSESLESLRERLPAAVDRETAAAEDSARALFGAIRSGSVKPQELGGYVDELGTIIREGGERIKAAAGEGRSPVLEGIDAELERLSPGQAALPRRPKALPDSDGVLRRIVPATEGGRGAEGKPRLIPWPRRDSSDAQRELPLDGLLAAVRDEEALAALLESAEGTGALAGEGAALPSRYRNAQRLGDEALAPESAPGEARSADVAAQAGAEAGAATETDRAADWREARADFFSSAAAYFSQAPDSSRASALAARLTAERERLSGILGGARVFLAFADPGPAQRDSFGHRVGAAYREAVIASALESPACPREAPRGAGIALSLLLAVVAGAVAYLVSPALGFAVGAGLAAFSALLSLLAFSLSGVFLTPLPLLLGPLATGAAAFALSFARPWAEPRRARFAIAAWEAPGLLRSLEDLGPEEGSAALASYRKAVRDAVAANGGRTILCAGTRLTAAFGEKRGAKPQSLRAMEAARASMAASGPADARVGLDEGDCLVQRGEPIGAAADLASRLSELCLHHGCRILATASVAALGGTEGAAAPKRIGEIEVEATGRKAEVFSIA